MLDYSRGLDLGLKMLVEQLQLALRRCFRDRWPSALARGHIAPVVPSFAYLVERLKEFVFTLL